MTVAVDLLDAANLTPQNLRPLWEANTLKTKMIAFWQQVSPAFVDELPNDHPIVNWLSIIAAFSPAILNFADNKAPGFTPYSGGTITTFSTSVDYIYRLCKFGFYYPLITPAQKAALLAAYNAQFS